MLHEKLARIYGLKRYEEVKLGLENVQALLSALGDPHKALNCVHIAGTNGKGSTGAMISSVLSCAGYKTGLYTSPHLLRFNERIRINGRPISDEELGSLIDEIEAKVREHDLQPTFFEFTTALMFLHFARAQVDIAVVEVGLGGQLDATNVITPLISIITHIGLDHTHWLGDTKEAIAYKKAGIIKKDVPIVIGEQDTALAAYIAGIAKERGAPSEVVQDLGTLVSKTLDSQTFSWKEEQYTIPLLGAHQLQNATSALHTLQTLEDKGFHVKAFVKEGLAKTKWSGRLEILSKDPLIVVDGAHNIAGFEAVKDFIKPFTKDVLIVAMADNKDVALVRSIAQGFTHVIITKGEHKAQDPFLIKHALAGKDVRVVEAVEDAVKEGLRLQSNGLLLITGSLYMIGKAMEQARAALDRSLA